MRALSCTIAVLAGMICVSCGSLVGTTLELKDVPGLKVERVEDHGTRFFLISGHNGNSGMAVLSARAKTKDGVARIVVTQVLVTPMRRDGSISVKVRDDGTVRKIVFGEGERQIWPAGT